MEHFVNFPGLCPHLSRCRSDQSEETSSDLQLGQCIHRHLNIECSRSSRFRELFQNSYERNRVSILEGMLREDQAVTLHPLKHDWMMQAVHRHTLTQSLAMVEKVRAIHTCNSNSLQRWKLFPYSRYLGALTT